MSNSYGEYIRMTIFGQSHSAAIGMTLEGIPAGRWIDMVSLQDFLNRRAPGNNPFSTARKEADTPEFLCGLVDDVTCGTPITAIIRNQDTRSKDYSKLKYIPRPGHADLTAEIKYKGFQDYAGGGHFSGRLTAPFCIAGGICLQLLAEENIRIFTRIASVGDIADTGDLETWLITGKNNQMLSEKAFPVLDDGQGKKMQEYIHAKKAEGDSVGGVIECVITGLPAGIGDHMFGGMENRISQAVFGIPAVKGIEFGAGFKAAGMSGSENNDAFTIEKTAECVPEENGAVSSRSEKDPKINDLKKIKTVTNHAGGILGGITNGMPLTFRAAFKPTPSIYKPQQSVDLRTMEETVLQIEGRHDPCIVLRALPCVEAAAALAVYDAMAGLER